MATLHADFMVGRWRVSPSRNRLSHQNQQTTIKHKSMAVLVCLADARGRVIPRNEILDAVWPNMAVTDDVLTQCIVELRKAFGDDAKKPRYIETVPKVGFRLVPETCRPVNSTATSRWQQIVLVATLAAISFVALWLADSVGLIGRDRIIKIDEPQSIAVLPFENLSADPDNAYYADGLADEIRILLGQNSGLKVIGRMSSQSVVEENSELDSIGQRLGVTNVLEGSIRKFGDQVRISVQLVGTEDSVSIWSNSYETGMQGIFAVQDDIAAAILDALHIHSMSMPARGEPTNSAEAYGLFLRARIASSEFEWREAEELLQQATLLDRDFAEAFELMAYNYFLMAGVVLTATDAQALVSYAAGEAVALDPTLDYAKVLFAATGLGPRYRRDSIRALENALRFRPNDDKSLEMQSWLLAETGYLEQSLALSERLFKVDPLSSVAKSHYETALYSVGRVEDALRLNVISDDGIPKLNFWTWSSFGILAAEGHYEKAIAALSSWMIERNYPDIDMARRLVEGAADPITGVEFLDKELPFILAHLATDDSFVWREELMSLYLYFGHLDRYYELIMETEPSDKTWHYAGIHAWRGVILRKTGFTAHPDYLVLASLLSIDDVWDDRGAPDYCQKSGSVWNCQ